MTSQTVLETHKLSAYFRDFCAVKEVSLQIKANQVTALIGPSGCGKSTFLRCLNRMHEEIEGASSTGQVLFQGRNIYTDLTPMAVRRSIGMVFQKPTPFPAMSIVDNVVSGLRLAGERNRKILTEVAERSLREAALWDEVKDKLHAPGSALSGGQQQRLCIARALAVAPPVLLMDEPTSALDPISTAKVEEWLVGMKGKLTVVIVTHNMQQAARVSDQTGFFLSGELVEADSTETIFTVPKDSRTESYITGRFG